MLDDEGNFVGFDVVIGNPPYIKGDEITDFKNYFSHHYQVFTGNGDLYTYFFEKSLDLLKPKSILNLITPNKWIQSNYGSGLRRLVAKYCVLEVIDFGELNVFDEASTFPSIIFISKESADNSNFKLSRIKSLDLFIADNYERAEISRNLLQNYKWHFDTDNTVAVIKKLERSFKTLGDVVGTKLFAGIKTGMQ